MRSSASKIFEVTNPRLLPNFPLLSVGDHDQPRVGSRWSQKSPPVAGPRSRQTAIPVHRQLKKWGSDSPKLVELVPFFRMKSQDLPRWPVHSPNSPSVRKRHLKSAQLTFCLNICICDDCSLGVLIGNHANSTVARKHLHYGKNDN